MSSVMMMKKLAPILVILAGCLWGTMGIFVRELNRMGLSAMEIVEMRCIIATMILFPIVLMKDKNSLKLRKRNLPPLICSGIFSILFFNFCYFSTISLMNLSSAAILLYTAPIFVMLMSLVLFHERLTGTKIAALVLAFGGCCLVSGIASASESLSVLGLLLGLGSGIGYALYSIFSRFSINQGLGAMTITAYTFLAAAVGGIFLTDFRVILGAFSQYGFYLLGYGILYTVITTILPYLLYTTGLGYVENGTASVMASVEPVVATILGFVVFSETPTVSALIGIVLVLVSLCLLNFSENRQKKL